MIIIIIIIITITIKSYKISIKDYTNARKHQHYGGSSLRNRQYGQLPPTPKLYAVCFLVKLQPDQYLLLPMWGEKLPKKLQYLPNFQALGLIILAFPN